MSITHEDQAVKHDVPQPTRPSAAPVTGGAETKLALLLTTIVGAAALTLMLSPLIYMALIGNGTGGTVSAGPAAGTAPAGSSAAVIATAAPAAGSAAKKGDPAAGKELFAANCVACHGDNGLGKANLGKDLVNSKWLESQSDAQLVTFLKKGRDAGDPLNTTKIPMPPKGGNPALNDTNLADLVAYMRKLQRGI